MPELVKLLIFAGFCFFVFSLWVVELWSNRWRLWRMPRLPTDAFGHSLKRTRCLQCGELYRADESLSQFPDAYCCAGCELAALEHIAQL